jgi:hypothetical protein
MSESAPMNSMIEPILARIPVAADMIGRGIIFIYEAIADGRIKAVKSDARTLVVVSSLREYAATLPPAQIAYDASLRRERERRLRENRRPKMSRRREVTA